MAMGNRSVRNDPARDACDRYLAARHRWVIDDSDEHRDAMRQAYFTALETARYDPILMTIYMLRFDAQIAAYEIVHADATARLPRGHHRAAPRSKVLA